MKKFLFNHCEVRVDLARVSPPRDTKLQNGRSVVANRAPLLFGCFVARAQFENAHKIVFQLVRTAEIRPRDGLDGFAAVFAVGRGI